jgi:DNA invertase Pin-like site-specific DNA recombinase
MNWRLMVMVSGEWAGNGLVFATREEAEDNARALMDRWMLVEAISTRTRQALAAAKARGVTLGNPKLSVARKTALAAVTTEADRFAANVLPIIREAQKAGATTLRDIASSLNARGDATARGGQWYAKSVANILERA